MKWFSRCFLGLGLLVVAYAGFSFTDNLRNEENKSAPRALQKMTAPTQNPGASKTPVPSDLPGMLEKRARTLGFQFGPVPEDFAGRRYPRLEEPKVRLANGSGDWIVLNFWASWCTPCRKEMPSLARLHEKMQDRDLRVLTVNVMEPPEDVRTFLRDENLDLPVLLDRKGVLTEAFRIEGLPVTWILAPGPEPLMQRSGAEQWDRGAIYQLLRDLTEVNSY